MWRSANAWREIGEKGEELEQNWKNILNKKNNKIKDEYERLQKGELPESLDKIFSDEKLKFYQSKPKMATRQSLSLIHI